MYIKSSELVSIVLRNSLKVISWLSLLSYLTNFGKDLGVLETAEKYILYKAINFNIDIMEGGLLDINNNPRNVSFNEEIMFVGFTLRKK